MFGRNRPKKSTDGRHIFSKERYFQRMQTFGPMGWFIIVCFRIDEKSDNFSHSAFMSPKTEKIPKKGYKFSHFHSVKVLSLK